jgi:class 3 adenylate cyclase/tetratricopeptide (TPR) repeat protein
MPGEGAGGPALLSRWASDLAVGMDHDAPQAPSPGPGPWSRRSGSLLKLDVEGFTELSSRLVEARRTGAEDLNAALRDVFAPVIDDVEDGGGDVLQFGGDALAVWFEADQNGDRAAGAARRALRSLGRHPPVPTPAGPVQLRMSAGLASGEVLFGLVGADRRDLVALGPVVTAALRAERRARPGELVRGAVGAGGPVGVAIPEAPAVRPGTAGEARPWLSPALIEHLGQDGLLADHRRAAIGFVSLDGLDDAVEAGRDDDVAALVDGTVRLVEGACRRAGVVWTATDLGVDSVVLLLYAGAPLASEHDAERMLRVVHHLVNAADGDGAVTARLKPYLRVGAHIGRVYAGALGGRERRTWAAIAPATNIAARLMAASEPRTALVTSTLCREARRRPGRATLAVRLKGVRERLDVFELRPGDELVDEADDPDPGPIVGREREVRRLAAALTDATDGRRRAVLLVGPAGIGKSRLLTAALSTDTPSRRLLCLAATPYDQDRAYASARPALRELLGADDPVRWRLLAGEDADLLPLLNLPLGVDLPPTAASSAIAAAYVAATRDRLLVRMLVRAVPEPLVVVAEDGQYLDRGTMGLLDALAAAPPESRLLVVVALRHGPGMPGAADDWPAVKPAWETITLGPLAADDARAVALQALGDRPVDDLVLSAVVAEGDGNALFVRELAILAATKGADGSELPDSVEKVIAARIDTLPPEPRRRLREAAVAGPESSLAVLADVLDPELASPEAWRPLAGFVSVVGPPGAERLRFHHDLFRHGAYEGLPVERRQKVHADLFTALTGCGEQPAVLAVHAQAAGRHLEAAELAFAAGSAAAAAGAWGDALASLRRAWQCGVMAEKADARFAEKAQGWLADVTERLGEAADLLGRFADAEEAYGEALARACPERRVRLQVARAAAVERQGRPREALRLLKEAERGVVPGDRRWAGVLLRRAVVLHRGPSIRHGLAVARTVAEAPDVGAENRARALLRMEMGASALGLPERRELGERALAAFDDLTHDREFGTLLLNLGVTAYADDDWHRALKLWAEAAKACEECGDVVAASIARTNTAEVLAAQGHDGNKTRVMLEDARRVLRASGHAFAGAHADGVLGLLVGRAGDHGRAVRLLTASAAAFTELERVDHLAETLAGRAEVEILAGSADALSWVRQAEEAAARAGAGGAVAAARCLLLHALLRIASGDARDVPERLAAALAAARGLGATYEEGRCLGLLCGVAPPGGGGGAAGRARRDEIAAELGVVAWPPAPSGGGELSAR